MDDSVNSFQFYHYTRPDLNISHVERLEHIYEQLVEGFAYFRRPNQLNDDEDCRPLLRVGTHTQVVTYIKRLDNRLRENGESPEIRRKARRRLQKELKSQGWLNKRWNEAVNNFGVLSLSERADNIHLWDTYAEKGEGVCIEYDLTMDSASLTEYDQWLPFKVEYVNVRPAINLVDYDFSNDVDCEQFVKHSLRSKTIRWAPEEEVRVVTNIGDAGSQKMRIPEGVIKTVYLGKNMRPEDRVTILNWSSDVTVSEREV